MYTQTTLKSRQPEDRDFRCFEGKSGEKVEIYGEPDTGDPWRRCGSLRRGRGLPQTRHQHSDVLLMQEQVCRYVGMSVNELKRIRMCCRESCDADSQASRGEAAVHPVWQAQPECVH